MAPLPHEGKHPILYGSLGVPIGSSFRDGYLARPDQAGLFPTVILLPGVDGLSGFDKHLARRFARWGLVCLVLDIYAGDEDPLTAYDLRSDKDIIGDLDEVYEFIQSDEVDWAIKTPVGVLGLDVGGRFSLITAAYRPWVGACGVVYTPLTGDENREYRVADLLGTVSAPVLGLYGADDDLIASETVDQAQLRNPGGTWLLYEGVGHSFFDDDGPNFHPGAAEDGFIRLRDFFLSNLPPALKEDLG